MLERAGVSGDDVLSSAVWDAVMAVARAASGRKDGRLAVAALSRQLGEAGRADLAGRFEVLAVQAAAEAAPGGWVERMQVAGELDRGQVRAAADIGRAAALKAGAAAPGLRAVDPSRLVVEGGPIRTDFALGGVAAVAVEVERCEAWRTAVRALGLKRAIVRGTEGSMYRDVLVTKVLVDGIAPFALDRQLGLRNGRSKETVLVELSRYAKMHFPS